MTNGKSSQSNSNMKRARSIRRRKVYGSSSLELVDEEFISSLAMENKSTEPSTNSPMEIGTNKDNNSDRSIKKQETLIGEHVPQFLKDLFKPIVPFAMSKEEAAVASYVLCHSMKENIDLKEILVRTKLEYCEGRRIHFCSMKPKGEIEQDVS
ncbi:hypothetical protein SESBI_09786 [Sesbania bispinosa]|nr:hypothetical protein SESBI_09786 [Sesbania bispinosa]